VFVYGYSVVMLRRKRGFGYFVFRELLRVGFQYGHSFVIWRNDVVPDFLFLYRAGFSLIFNLGLSAVFLRRGLLFLKFLSVRGSKVLFVDRTPGLLNETLGFALRGFLDAVATNRWLGGTLTNFRHTVLRNLRRLFTQKKLGISLKQTMVGLRNLRFLPNVVVVSSLLRSVFCVNETNLLSLPSIGVVDSDATQSFLTFPVFGNDDSAAGSLVLMGAAATTVSSGRLNRSSQFFKFLNVLLVKRLGLRLKLFKRRDRPFVTHYLHMSSATVASKKSLSRLVRIIDSTKIRYQRTVH